jgi:hypothetical protein
MVYGIEFSTDCARTTFDGPLSRIRKLIYYSTKQGNWSNFAIKWGEWWEARDRASGRLDVDLAFFTSIFEPAASGRSEAENGDASSSPDIDPPPYTP